MGCCGMNMHNPMHLWRNYHLGDSLIHEYPPLVIAFQCAIYNGPDAQGIIFVNRPYLVVSNDAEWFCT